MTNFRKGEYIMRMNPSLVKLNVSAKLAQQAMDAVVTEAVARALPFDKRSIARDMKYLHSYVSESLKGIDSLNLLAAAMENDNLNPDAQIFLENLYEATYITALEAADRIAMEQENTPNMKEIVDSSKFTPEEMKRFQKRSENLNLKDMSRIINKKVTAVLKDEMKSYEEERALRDELKETIQQQKEELDARLDKSSDDLNGTDQDPTPEMTDNEENSEGETLESYLSVALHKNDVRHHISLFSKLQDVAMEEILHTNEQFDELPYMTTLKATLESTFPDFTIDNLRDDLQLQLLEYASESVVPQHTATECANAANLAAVLMYTFMETLKTMNLWNPSQGDIKNFINKPVAPSSATPNLPKMVASNIQDKIRGVMNTLSTMNNPDSLQVAFDQCENCKKQINDLGDQFNGVKESVIPMIDQAMDLIIKRKNEIAEQNRPAEESVFVAHRRLENTAAFNRIANVYGHRPDVKQIVLSYSPASENAFVDVNILGAGFNNVVGTDFVSLNRNPEFGSLDKCVHEAAQESALARLNVPVYIYNEDKCEKIPFLNI